MRILFKRLIYGASAAVIAFSTIAYPPVAMAVSNNSGQALEIGPPIINLTADPGQTIKAQVSVKNISSGTMVVGAQVNDFVAGGEDGTPKILLGENDTSPYSLIDWVTPFKDMTLKSRQQQDLPVTIHIPANASPGGYYGVIRFTATPPELKNTGVSLSASVGALIMLRISGQARESMSIEEFSVNHNGSTGNFFETTPLSFVERIKNTGNVFEQPTGQVIVTDMFGSTIAAVNVNLASSNVLPDSIRKFEQPLDSATIGDRILFGQYTAELKLTYGANQQALTQKINFWVIPYTLIAAVIASLVGSFYGIRYLIRRYNRYIINLSQNQNKPK